MEGINKFQSVGDYNKAMGLETLHPLVSVIDYKNVSPMEYPAGHEFNFYAVFLKEGVGCNIRYGRNYYDYQEGTLVFTAPGQVVKIEDRTPRQPKGMGLFFHSDLIRGTTLGRNIKDFTFFSYEVYEALHLSEQERRVVIDCFRNIETELKRGIDKHSKTLIVSNIELFLNYCIRFYDRQFITRSHINSDILSRFESLLNDYFKSGLPASLGLPTVKYCAGQLHLSANYLGDLLKKETGKNAREHIQSSLIEAAKEKIFQKNKTVSEIAFELGFEYPQYFSRLFKKRVGISPNEYRMTN